MHASSAIHLQRDHLILLQTHIIGTEVVFEDPAVEQFGLQNFLGTSFSPKPRYTTVLTSGKSLLAVISSKLCLQSERKRQLGDCSINVEMVGIWL